MNAPQVLSGILLVALMLVPSMEAETRQFKDAKGRVIEAELVARSGSDSVVIKRGENEYTVKIAMFSVDDQLFIQEWIKENPKKVKVDAQFSYFIRFEDGATRNEIADIDDRDERLKRQKHVVDVSVGNRGDHPIENLTIEHRIFIEDFVDTRGNRFRQMSVTNEKAVGRIQRISGIREVEVLEPDSREDFKIAFETQRYVDRDFGRVAAAAADVIMGMWIRVYHNGQLIGEYQKNENGSLRNETWDEEDL